MKDKDARSVRSLLLYSCRETVISQGLPLMKGRSFRERSYQCSEDLKYRSKIEMDDVQ